MELKVPVMVGCKQLLAACDDDADAAATLGGARLEMHWPLAAS